MSSQTPRLISKRAAAAHGRASGKISGSVAEGSASSSPSSSSSPSAVDFLVAGVAAVTLAITGIRLYKAMHVPLTAGKMAVVYDARRRSIFSTPYDQCGTLKEALTFCRSKEGKKAVGGFASLAGLKLVLGAALFPCTKRYLTRPPLPWYKVFEIPRSVLQKNEGVQIVCRVEDVPTNSSTRVNVEVAVHFYIDLNNDLERYLSLCGPVGPSDHVGKAVGYCVRSHASSVDAGVLLSPQRRENYFMKSFSDHVTSKLLADCAIRVLSVSIKTVRELQLGNGVVGGSYEDLGAGSLNATYSGQSFGGRSAGNSYSNFNVYDDDYDDGGVSQYSNTTRTTEPYNASMNRL